MNWSAEAKVGLVTIVGVLLFTFVVVSLAHTEVFGKPGYPLHILFKDANGLHPGNSVRYVGVNVGKVESVTPSKDGVDVRIKLNKGTEIPRDSKASITTDGLLGEKIVSITAGEDRENLAAEGDYLSGSDAKTVNDMMKSADKLLTNVNLMMRNVNTVIGDEKTQAAMRGSLQNLEALTGNANGMMEANAGNVQQMTANMAAMTTALNESVQRLDGDGSLSDNMRATVGNIKSISDRFENIARSMESIATDPQSSADIKTTLHNTAQISDKVNHFFGGKGDIKMDGDVGLLYNDTKNESRGHVNFKVYRGNTFALLGAENIGGGTGLDLQYGRRSRFFDSRIGLINGDLGGGLDFFVDKPFRLSLEGYNPDDWRYRLKAQFRLTSNMYLFGQFTRPMDRSDGGNYYGINYVF